MNTKSLLLVAALCGSTPLVPLFAQGGGGAGGGSGSSGGSAGSGSGSSAGSNSGTSASASSATAPSSSRTSGASNASGTSATPGAPNTSSSMPSRSVLNTESPGNPNNARAANPGNLPPGLSVAPATPGVSPVSGIPVSNLPAVSPGTEPLGPNAKVPPATSPVSSASEAGTQRQNPAATTTTTDPASVAPHPQTNTLIGQGTTTVVPTPPPAVPTEVTPRSVPNETGMVWIDGHYSWLGGQWSWVNGNWQRPPSEGARWIPGSYDAQNKRWTEGHWDRGANPAPRAPQTTAPQR